MMKRYFILIHIVLFSISLSGQISRGGNPYFYHKSLKSSSGLYQVPSDFIEVQMKNLLEDSEKIEGKKSLTFALNYPVKISPARYGIREEDKNGNSIWYLEIYSPGAKGLSVFFDKFALNDDVWLFLYTPEHDYVLGGFNSSTNKKSGVLQTSYIPGDRLILELQVPEGRDPGELRLGSISHAFIDIFGKKDEKDNYFGRSGDCEIDINCETGDLWQDIKHSVVRIIFKRTSYISEMCTATLINNTGYDGTPFLYTANHCIGNDTEAESLVALFNYESSVCNGEDGDNSMSLSGAEILATSDSLDFSLLLLSEKPPEDYLPYYAGWSISEIPSQRSVAIHHPRGDVKKISVDTDPLTPDYQVTNPPSWLENGSTPGAFWRVADWEQGATEGGSSGCPLFNPDKRIVGNLTGGEADCLNPVNDYFSKFYMDWDYYPEPERQLKSWLDSLDLNPEYIDAYDPLNLNVLSDTHSLKLYPNPGNGIFTLSSDNYSLSGGKISVYGMNGELLFQRAFEAEKWGHFDLSFLPGGIYIMEIHLDNYYERKKIVIIH